MVHANRLYQYLGPVLRSWTSEGEETGMPVVCWGGKAGCAEDSEPATTRGPISVVVRRGELSSSVARESVLPVS